MALVCNIDQRGRSLRYRIGFGLLAFAALAFALLSRFVVGSLPLFVAGAITAGGLFSLFEANRGWCAARALGFKTKL